MEFEVVLRDLFVPNRRPIVSVTIVSVKTVMLWKSFSVSWAFLHFISYVIRTTFFIEALSFVQICNRH